MTVEAKIKQALTSTEAYLLSLGVSQRPKVLVDGQERRVYLTKLTK
jgi:hypothetical protein